jgi:RND family efflux transporter MFP subunit
VAVRNAELYKEVPFIGVLEPLLQRKQRFMRMEKGKRTAYLVLAAAALLFLVFFPLPMRVEGVATVGPLRRALIQPEFEGVVKKVYVREGDAVRAGTVLADLDDWEYRAALASADAKYQTALGEMNRALAANDGTEAGIQRAKADFWAGESMRAKERLDRTHLRSSLNGVIATPHLENMVGRRLGPGDTLAEVVDDSRATLDVEVDDTDLPLVRPGEKASVKLETFPTRTFRGTVSLVSPRGQIEGDHRTFFARVDIPNPDGSIRPGMEGRSKLSVGWRPAGYVLFRSTAMWFWSKLWSWFGW